MSSFLQKESNNPYVYIALHSVFKRAFVLSLLFFQEKLKSLMFAEGP